MPDPVLSVVVTSRNDDHGDNPLRRMQLFLTGLITQCQRHQLAAELIVVEWNPPADRPPLAEVLHYPADLTWCPVRFITVPPELHAQLQHSQSLPLFQMIAKNVGIRRARGQFVLATNIDILFSDELIRHIAQGQLQPDRMYRIDRHDIMANVPDNVPIDEQLTWCRSHLIRLNARTGTFPLTPDGRKGISPADIFTPDQGIQLGEGWYAPEYDAGEKFCWVGAQAELHLRVPSADTPQVLNLELEPGPGVGWQPFTLAIYSGVQMLARATIHHRQRVALAMPAEVTSVRFHAVEGGLTYSDTPRVLNYRVFGGRWEAGPAWEPLPLLGTANANAVVQPAWNVTAQDVAAPDAGIRFGAGWDNPERELGQSLRWAKPCAWLQLTAPANGANTLVLHVEPGPGVDGHAFVLDVRTESGQVLASGTVTGRQEVRLALPLTPGQTLCVECHTPDGGLPLPHSARVINFRVLRADWETGAAWQPTPTANFQALDLGEVEANDILGPGIRCGQGWHPVETCADERMRWATPDAVLVVAPPVGLAWPVVCLETEPALSVIGPTARLELVDLAGTVVASADLRYRQRVYLRLPVAEGKFGRFRCRVSCAGRTLAPDTLMFRIFSARWVSAAALSHENSRVEDIGQVETADLTTAGIRFGRGWDPVELWNEQPMRWAGDNACLVVTAPATPGTHALWFDAGPGYATGDRPCDLFWETETGQPVGHVRLTERGQWRLDVPTTPGKELRLIARVPNGGTPVANTTRVLNFRLFAINWGPGRPWQLGAANITPVTYPVSKLDPTDVVPADAGIAFAGDWYHAEPWGGEWLRWAPSGVGLVLTPPADATHLRLDVEVGPGVPAGATTVTVRDEAGQVVCALPLAGRHWLTVPVSPPPLGTQRVVTLHLSGAGQPVGHDWRQLDFRLFAAEWTTPVVTAPTPTVTSPSAAPVARTSPVRRPYLLRRTLFSRVLQFVRGTPAQVADIVERPALPHEDPYLRALREQPPTAPSGVNEVCPVELHTNACGDFTLIDRERWFALQGYPEFEVFSMHLDTLFCYIAHHGGAPETVLPEPMRIYHIEHGTGSGWTPEGAQRLTERIRAKGIPFLECSDVFNWGTQMRVRETPLLFNRADWGMAAEELPETAISGRRRRTTSERPDALRT